MLRCARWLGAGLAGTVTVISLVGCRPIDFENGVSLPELVLSSEAVRPPASARYVEAESNDDFDVANLVSVDGTVQLVGDIAPGSEVLDVDLYDLGPANAGDRIIADIDVEAANDVQLGIFDASYRLLGVIIPSSQVNGPAQIDMVLHESTIALYAAGATRSGSLEERPYTARVTLRRGTGVPACRSQIVVLNFQGGDGISIGGRAPIDIPPFDAINIGPEFAGQTEGMINRIMAMVAEDYAGLHVDIYRASDPYIPAGEQSVIYFGTYDERLLGLADNIDPYNADASQSAVIYTDTFALFRVLSPSVEEISQILANVASHEAGHLLGLRHTSDPRSLMDITATARQMLLDQWFRVADLHPSVMSIGVQDAPALLSWAVGGTPPKPPATRLATLRRARELADDPNDFYIPRSELMTCFCPACAGHDHDEKGADGQMR